MGQKAAIVAQTWYFCLQTDRVLHQVFNSQLLCRLLKNNVINCLSTKVAKVLIC